MLADCRVDVRRVRAPEARARAARPPTLRVGAMRVQRLVLDHDLQRRVPLLQRVDDAEIGQRKVAGETEPRKGTIPEIK